MINLVSGKLGLYLSYVHLMLNLFLICYRKLKRNLCFKLKKENP